MAPSASVSATAFAKTFEVLFCGHVSVAHKKAPPALIDECIEKFSQLQNSGTSSKRGDSGAMVSGLKKGIALPSNGLEDVDVGSGSAGSPTTGKQPVLFKRDPSFTCLQALDENGLSPEISYTNTMDPYDHTTGIRPTSQQENRTMLFMVNFINVDTFSQKQVRSNYTAFVPSLFNNFNPLQ